MSNKTRKQNRKGKELSQREKRYLKKHFLTDHHINPSSKGGGVMDNIAQISHDKHKKYHWLFENKDPLEILAYLERYFWGGQTKWIDDYQRRN